MCTELGTACTGLGTACIGLVTVCTKLGAARSGLISYNRDSVY